MAMNWADFLQQMASQRAAANPVTPQLAQIGQQMQPGGINLNGLYQPAAPAQAPSTWAFPGWSQTQPVAPAAAVPAAAQAAPGGFASFFNPAALTNAQGQTMDQYFAAKAAAQAVQAAAAPAAIPAGGLSDALFGDNVQHPGWNHNPDGTLAEMGPPGSPDYVRNPKTQKDYNDRFAYFHGQNVRGDGAGDMSMLHPAWTPINMYYNQKNPQALATLAKIAAGQLQGYGITATGTPWTAEQAQAQLRGWGYGPKAGGGGGGYGGGGGPAAPGQSTYSNQLPGMAAYQGQPAPSGYTAGLLKDTMYEPGSGSARVGGRAGGQPYQPNTYYPNGYNNALAGQNTNPYGPTGAGGNASTQGVRRVNNGSNWWTGFWDQWGQGFPALFAPGGALGARR